MSVLVAGILKDPLGNPLVEDTLRFTALNSMGDAVEGSSAVCVTGADGSYNVTLSYGKFLVEGNYLDEYHLLGTVYTDLSTPSPITVGDLILLGSPVVPPLIVDTDPVWAQLFADVKTNGDYREVQYQIREGDKYTSETKELWIALTASMTDESLESSVGSTKAITQLRAYEDEAMNQASLHTQEGLTDNIHTYSSMEAYEASNGKEEIKRTEVLTGTKAKIESTKHVTDDSLAITEEVTFEGTSCSSEVTANSDSLAQSSRKVVGDHLLEESYEVNPTHLGSPFPKGKQAKKLKLDALINSVSHEAEVYNKQETAISIDELATALHEAGVKVYSKEAFQRLTLKGGHSKQVTQVDEYVIQDHLGNPLSEFDTVNNRLKVYGKLEVDNPEDFKGDTGDTEGYIFEYSRDNGVTDPWHSTYDSSHPDRWRRDRRTVNGVPVGAWSEGFYLNAKDGRDGDTYFNQFQYSTDNVSKALNQWHTNYVTGDDWRRWRVIENGVPVTSGHEFYGPENGWWEERMKGLDGPAGWVAELQYQYSVDNLPPWHNDFITGDLYRRERVMWYASTADFLLKDDPVSPSTPAFSGTWTSGAKIAPESGVDYGEKYATIMMYKRSNAPLLAGDEPALVTYDFTTATISPATSNGWTSTIPEGLEDIWIAVGTAYSKTDTDTVDDWVVERQVANGYKSAVAWLYQVTDADTTLTDSHLPNAPLNYDFLTGKVLSGAGLNGWLPTIPNNIPDGGKLWVTHNTALTPVANNIDTLDAPDWETPSVLAMSGTVGVNGAGWFYINNISSSWFSSTEAFNWATYGQTLVTNFNSAFGRPPVNGDILSVSTSTGSHSDTGMYIENTNRFEYIASRVNGNMLVDGTLNAAKIKSNSITASKIAAGTITANEIDANVIFGDQATFKGALSVGSAGQFNVNNTGAVTIQGGSSSTGMTITNSTITVKNGGVVRVKMGLL